ncbi:MAG: LamG-like jellyroll fold domain-containing protein [Bacteroidales bacterium]|jgi:gliding motility-associated-like protein
MPKNILQIFFLIIVLCNFSFAQNKNKDVFTGCAADDLMQKNSMLHQSQNNLDAKAFKYFIESNNTLLQGSRTTVYIPVVVHIIHNNGPENISNTQVETAIADINAKYAQSNNYRIQFCLAQRDPQGNTTNGITRNVSALTTETMEVDDISLKNINCWNPYCYLNIWVIKEILSQSMGSGVIGYAYLPSAHGLNMDGVVLEANYFGSSAVSDAVGTHEIGHYLGLYHTFQNGCKNDDCLIDGDLVCDTPPDQTTFASCNHPTNSCNTDADDKSTNNPFKTDVADYSDDYMDYSSLSCYDKFTPGQYSRMQYFLTNVRSSLLNCLSCATPCPTPITAKITVPGSPVNISIGTNINFTATATNSNNYQWYINPTTIISTTLNASYTFNAAGYYWMKFKAISNNTFYCLDAVDSIDIIVRDTVVYKNGLVACYPFNGNANDESGNGNNGTVHGATLASDRFGNSNSAYDFDGTDDFILVNNSPSLESIENNNAVSITTWIYIRDWYQSWNIFPILQKCRLFDNKGWGFEIADKYKKASTFFTNDSLYLALWTPNFNQWYHVAVTYDRTIGKVKFFINGNFIGSAGANRSLGSTNGGPLFIGKSPWGVLEFSDGKIDDISIYNRALTDSEILDLYKGTSPCCINQPVVNLGNDTIICKGNSLELDAKNTGSSYKWNSGETTQKINVANSGKYYVTVYNGSCFSVDSVNIKVANNNSPKLDLGSDISMCTSATHTFDAGTGFKEYLWNDGSKNRTYTAYHLGKYWVTVKDSCGGIQSDTVNITLFPSPTLDLGNDTSICPCDSILLHYFTNGVYQTFQWSPSTGLSCSDCANPYFRALGTNKYYLVATTADGCANMDSINIIVNPKPTISTTGENVCFGSSATITASGALNYTWSNGIFTSFISVNPTSNTIYSVTGSDVNGCSNTLQVVVNVYQNPNINVTGNNSICIGQHDTISVNGCITYIWSNGSQNSTIIVTPTSTTKYFVTGSDNNGCTATDSITVNFINMQIPSVNLGNDTAICSGQQIILSTYNPNYLSYLWQDGSTASSFTVLKHGLYWVRVSDICGTTGDSIIIAVKEPPYVNLGNDTTICTGDKVTIQLPVNGNTYIWQDSSKSNYYIVKDTGLYVVRAANICGSFRDSIHFKGEDCNCNIDVPSAFSPNGDNENDILYLRGKCIENINFYIYDRWGQKVFESHYLSHGWDGTFNGKKMDAAVFVYYLSAETSLGKKRTIKKQGNISLVR